MTDPLVSEILEIRFTSGRKHLTRKSQTFERTACGRSISDRQRALSKPIETPWLGDDKCKTCLRILEAGGLGYRVAAAPDEGPFITKTGRELTDQDIEHLADEAEAGYDVSHLAPGALCSPTYDRQPFDDPIPEGPPESSSVLEAPPLTLGATSDLSFSPVPGRPVAADEEPESPEWFPAAGPGLPDA